MKGDIAAAAFWLGFWATIITWILVANDVLP